MYRKCIGVFLLFGFVVSSAHKTILVEVKPSYFFFSQSLLRRIYHHGGFEIQGAASYRLCHWLALYASIGYRHVRGRALNTGEKTSLREIPLDLGLKPTFEIGECVDYYFAFGPRIFPIHQHNDSQFVDKNLHRTGVGLFVNSGFNFHPLDHLSIGFFGEYSYERKSFKSSMPFVFGKKHVQVGGFAWGVSVGYAF